MERHEVFATSILLVWKTSDYLLCHMTHKVADQDVLATPSLVLQARALLYKQLIVEWSYIQVLPLGLSLIKRLFFY